MNPGDMLHSVSDQGLHCLPVIHLFEDTKLDEHPTGDQEVAGLTPTGSATFFHGD